MPPRSVRARRTTVTTRRLTGVKRSRSGYSTYPFSRTLYRRRRVTGSRYSYGVAGTNRFIRRSAGRDIPLYLPPRPRRFAEVHAYPQAEDASLHNIHFDTSGSIVHLNPIAKGDSLQERQGDRVFMLRLLLRGAFRAQVATEGSRSTALSLQNATFYVVYDRQPQGALPPITDIFDGAEPSSLQRLDTRDRFFILLRHQFQVEVGQIVDTAGTGYQPVVTSDSYRNVDWNIPISRAAVFTTAESSGAIANVRTGALYAIFVGAASPIYSPVANLHYRISFSDSQ